LVGQFFNPYISLNIDELDSLPNSSTSNFILNSNCDSYCFELHLVVYDCNVHVVSFTTCLVVYFNFETFTSEAELHFVVSNCNVHVISSTSGSIVHLSFEASTSRLKLLKAVFVNLLSRI
jgi:hypothetical protein